MQEVTWYLQLSKVFQQQFSILKNTFGLCTWNIWLSIHLQIVPSSAPLMFCNNAVALSTFFSQAIFGWARLIKKEYAHTIGTCRCFLPPIPPSSKRSCFFGSRWMPKIIGCNVRKDEGQFWGYVDLFYSYEGIMPLKKSVGWGGMELSSLVYFQWWK